jgi:hypothetical protein
MRQRSILTSIDGRYRYTSDMGTRYAMTLAPWMHDSLDLFVTKIDDSPIVSRWPAVVADGALRLRGSCPMEKGRLPSRQPREDYGLALQTGLCDRHLLAVALADLRQPQMHAEQPTVRRHATCFDAWLQRRAAAGAQAQSGVREARSKRANAVALRCVAGRLVVPSQNAAMVNSRLATQPAETVGAAERAHTGAA